MKDSIQRIASIIRADFILRFRRPSTAAIFLLACICAYLFIPALSTGRAFMQIAGHRAFYNSAAISMGSAIICTLLFGLAAFYMMSNTVQKDVQTRTGFVIASTTVRNWEYLTGKFLGNVVFMTALIGGFMLSCMVMQLIRGEAPLEPLVFLKQYLLITPPQIFFVSAMALFFETVPFLSGKVGAAFYFFVWIFALTASAVGVENQKGSDWQAYVDLSGLDLVITQVHEISNSNSLQIGGNRFNPAEPPFVFRGLSWQAKWILPRLVSMMIGLPFLLISLFTFHRFNPARLKKGAQSFHQNLLATINRKLKPLSAVFTRLTARTSIRGNSFLGGVISDFILTLQRSPVAILAITGFAIASLILPVDSLQKGMLPAMFVALTVVLSDIATRDKNSATLDMLYSSPFLKTGYVWWKFASTFLVAMSFAMLAIIRLAIAAPPAAISLLVGTILTAAVAVALGVISGNPKTFIVTFLMFLYLALNDGGHSTSFDFAGWYGTATVATRVVYMSATIAFLTAAQLVYSLQLRRR